MNCHQAIGTESEALAPVRDSFAKDEPIEWVNVHMLPDYAFFDHSVHVAAGVGCATCHGRVDQMDVVKQVKPMNMAGDVNCHRDPHPHLRPRDEVTNMAWEADPEKTSADSDPHRTRSLTPPQHCSGCHF